jgi:hypothetical protein
MEFFATGSSKKRICFKHELNTGLNVLTTTALGKRHKIKHKSLKSLSLKRAYDRASVEAKMLRRLRFKNPATMLNAKA